MHLVSTFVSSSSMCSPGAKEFEPGTVENYVRYGACNSERLCSDTVLLYSSPNGKIRSRNNNVKELGRSELAAC